MQHISWRATTVKSVEIVSDFGSLQVRLQGKTRALSPAHGHAVVVDA